MGVCSQYVAVKSCDLDAVGAVLGLRRTGKRVDFPESDFVGKQLPMGYALVVLNGSHLERLFSGGTIKRHFLRELSNAHEVILTFVEEHVMFSTTSCWKNGELLWSVTHESEKGLFHLDTLGPVPKSLEAIQQNLFAKQAEGGGNADVDFIFDIPVRLAQALTGYRYDQDIPGMSDQAFEVLEPVKQAGGLLRRIFGRKNQR